MNTGELTQRMLKIAQEMRDAEEAARLAVEKAASAERDYRKRDAIAFIQCDGRNVDERRSKAEVLAFNDENTVGDLRFKRDLARDMRDVAKEVIRNRRQELSALQTLGRLAQEEAAFDRTGAREQPEWTRGY